MAKTKRLYLRLGPADKDLLRTAAILLGSSVSEVARQGALTAARATIVGAASGSAPR